MSYSSRVQNFDKIKIFGDRGVMHGLYYIPTKERHRKLEFSSM